MGRAPCCDKTIVKKGPWSPEEDAILKDYIENYGFGGNWIALPQKIGINRCGKSCRLRWLNYLRPNIKHGGFSEEEDNIICSLYISIGSRWSIIAAQLPGRTDNDIKNYWNTKLKKKLLKRRKQSQPNRYSISSDDMKDSKAMEALSNSAIERLQLHMQLQSHVNPNTSNFANFPMWPCKLNPNQEQMIRNLHFLNESSNPPMMQHFSHIITPQNIELDASPNNSLQQAYFPLNNMMVNEMDNLVNDESNISGSSTSHVSEPDDTEQRRMELQNFWVLQAEMDNFLANKRANIVSLDQVQTGGFDDLKEMDCANSSMPTWSSNVFDWSILDLDN